MASKEFPPLRVYPYTEIEINDKVARVAKMIKRLTGGFLEVIEFPDRNGFLRRTFTTSRVRFIHRTASDFFLQDNARQKDLENSWPNFQENELYGRVFLSEFVFGLDTIIIPSKMGRYLQDASVSSIDVDTFGALKVVISRHVFPGTLINKENVFSDGRSSIVHLAAFFGLHDFVLSEYAKDVNLSRTHHRRLKSCHGLYLWNKMGLGPHASHQRRGT